MVTKVLIVALGKKVKAQNQEILQRRMVKLVLNIEDTDVLVHFV